MPIIVQAFEEAALDKYATLSDLPLVLPHSYDNVNLNWEKFGTKYHGVAPH